MFSNTWALELQSCRGGNYHSTDSVSMTSPPRARPVRSQLQPLSRRARPRLSRIPYSNPPRRILVLVSVYLSAKPSEVYTLFFRTGHSAHQGPHPICEMAGIRPPSEAKGYPSASPEGSPCYCPILPHPGQEHGHSAFQTTRQVRPRPVHTIPRRFLFVSRYRPESKHEKKARLTAAAQEATDNKAKVYT